MWRRNFAALVVIYCGIAAAQNSAGPRISPVPLWPLDGKRTGVLANYSVFINPETSEIVILAPDPSKSAPRELRFGLPIFVDASLAFSMLELGNGRRHYSFAITDSPRARQRTERLGLLLPANDSAMSPISAEWSFASTPTALADRGNPAHKDVMRLVYWTDPSHRPDRLQGFTLGIQSSYLPGFAEAFLQGQVENPLTSQIVASLPEPVAAQARLFLQPEWSSQRHLAFAPLFAPDTPRRFIAENYFFGITRLTQTGVLETNSAFASAALASLQSFLQSEAEIPAFAPPGSPPRTQVEREIQKALDIAFR